MGQNDSKPDRTDRTNRNYSSSMHPPTYSSTTQDEIIKVLAEENREKDEVIKRQRNIILKEKQEESATILKLKKEILENENKSVLQALEEETNAKKKAIIEKERVVREKELQLKEQERIIQIQKEELEKHKEITKNVLEEVVQKQTSKPATRFNHQYKFNDNPTVSNVETKLHNMQIGSKDKSAANYQNKSKNLNKSTDVRKEPPPSVIYQTYGQKNVLHEPSGSRPNVHYGQQQMYNHPSNFHPNLMAPYPPFPQSFGQNMIPPLLTNDPRFSNFTVPPPNIPNLNKKSAANMGPNNPNSKENPSRSNEVFQKQVLKSDSSKKSVDDKYAQVNVAQGSGKEHEKLNADSDKDSTASDTKNNDNKTRRRRRYGRNKVYTNSKTVEVAKAQNLDSNAKKSDKRMIGQFQCPKCLKSWKSATAYIGVSQQCARCQIDVAPTKLESMNKHREDLCGKCKELGRSCREMSSKKTKKVPGEKEKIDDISD